MKNQFFDSKYLKKCILDQKEFKTKIFDSKIFCNLYQKPLKYITVPKMGSFGPFLAIL